MADDDLDPVRLVKERARIRVYDFQGNLTADGVVVAYCDQPTIVVATGGGQQGHYPIGMHRERVQEHKFDITKEEQRKRGWYLAWHCRHKDCDSRGDLTVPSRDKAYELLTLLDDGHRELPDG